MYVGIHSFVNALVLIIFVKYVLMTGFIQITIGAQHEQKAIHTESAKGNISGRGAEDRDQEIWARGQE